MLIEGRLDQYVYPQLDPQAQAKHWALQLYHRASNKNWIGQIRSVLSGQCLRLLNLASVQVSCIVLEHRNIGIQTVPISQIRGSANQSRSWDFDVNFRPLQAHNKTRWLSIATAQRLGVKLPPVSLIQVGEIYFIEDGHHRISVARALGQQEMAARVTVWKVAGPLPWEKQAATHLDNARGKIKNLELNTI